MEGAAYSCPFSGEGRFEYIGMLLKVHIVPEANSLDLLLKETVCMLIFLNSVFFMNKYRQWGYIRQVF